MAYADQEMGGNKTVTLVIVAIIHIVVIYALVTGLAYDAVKKVTEKLETFDVEEEKPPEEPPPPPPEQKQATPPPIIAPPPPFVLPRPAPDIQTEQKPVERPYVATVTAKPTLDPGPAIVASKAKGAVAKGKPGSWANSDDYPSRALREEREGRTGFRVTIGPDGKVASCTVTSSSGSPDLDDATCKNVTRRARFSPALDAAGNPTNGTYANTIVWQIPK